jgi:hypothetical protein
MSVSSWWSIPFWLSNQNPTCILFSPMHATCPAHHILLESTIGEEYKL